MFAILFTSTYCLQISCLMSGSWMKPTEESTFAKARTLSEVSTDFTNLHCQGNISVCQWPGAFSATPPASSDPSPSRFQNFLADLRRYGFIGSTSQFGDPHLEPVGNERAPSVSSKLLHLKAANLAAELADLRVIQRYGSPEERAWTTEFLSRLGISSASQPVAPPGGDPTPRTDFGKVNFDRLVQRRRSSSLSSSSLDELFPAEPRLYRHSLDDSRFATSAVRQLLPSSSRIVAEAGAVRPYFVHYPYTSDRHLYEQRLAAHSQYTERGPSQLNPARRSHLASDFLQADLGTNEEAFAEEPAPGAARDAPLQRRSSFGLDTCDKDAEQANEPSGKKTKRKAAFQDGSTLICHVCTKEVDVSDIKKYIRCRKICNVCRTADSCIKNGLIVKYCQLCSWVHPLDEFDEGRRSCRSELTKHNIRRRKKTNTVVCSTQVVKITRSLSSD